MPRAPDVICDFWEWYNRRSRQRESGVRELALDKCEEAFRYRDWRQFARWYEIYRRERPRHHGEPMRRPADASEAVIPLRVQPPH
jgi:hypothetical protein